jgi:hypothetical protein
VSELDGHAVLVTEFVDGERVRGGRAYGVLGVLLGRLHARGGEEFAPGEAGRGPRLWSLAFLLWLARLPDYDRLGRAIGEQARAAFAAPVVD